MGCTELLEISRRQFNLSFSMLERIIYQCPADLWNEKNGGFVFWQQLLHTLTAVDFWMRKASGKFTEPFANKRVYPELDKDPEDNLSREQLIGYMNKVKEVYEVFFENKDDEWLCNNSVVHDKIKNIDIIFMQIRHIQYHVGHCNSILRDKGREAVEWIDYFGE
ncbi:MAG: DinB family protein [Bacillota bacterium]|nr:DinB family protein [Bacillota bacterium]